MENKQTNHTFIWIVIDTYLIFLTARNLVKLRILGAVMSGLDCQSDKTARVAVKRH